MWSKVFSFLSVVFLFSPGAMAQAKGPAPQEPGTNGGQSSNEATTTPGQATEPRSVQASPDVQAQVGLGTEKEDATQDSYDPSSPFEGDAERERRARKKDYGHLFQVGARGGISIPYKILFRFDDSPACDVNSDGDEEGKVCGLLAPAAVDLALSFAVLDAVEPYVWMRFGLGDENKTQTQALRVFGAGVRIYTMSSSMFKVFFEPAVGVETEGALTEAAAANANYGTDVYLHLNAGLQVDFIRQLGVYFAVGPNVSFVRAISTTLEANAGLQFRLP